MIRRWAFVLIALSLFACDEESENEGVIAPYVSRSTKGCDWSGYEQALSQETLVFFSKEISASPGDVLMVTAELEITNSNDFTVGFFQRIVLADAPDETLGVFIAPDMGTNVPGQAGMRHFTASRSGMILVEEEIERAYINFCIRVYGVEVSTGSVCLHEAISTLDVLKIPGAKLY